MISKQRFNEVISEFEKIDCIFVLGDIGIDKYSIGEVTRISPEAPVPVVKVTQEWNKLGLSANISENLNCLKIKSCLFGVLGDDYKNKIFTKICKDGHMPVAGLITEPGRSTTFKERVVAKSQQVCRIDYEDDHLISELSRSRLMDSMMISPTPSAIIIEDYGKGVVDEQLIQLVLKKYPKAFIAVDPSIKKNPNIYSGVDLLKPNLKEARAMMKALGESESQEPVEMIKKLSTLLDIKNIVITLGEKGMLSYVAEQNQVTHCPTLAREVFDVSGAGDTSIALIVSSILAGANLEEASWLANIGAGVVVGKNGTATVSLEELEKYYERVSE